MKRFKVLLFLIVLVVSVSSLTFATDLKEISLFSSDPLPDYPGSTILGEIIREETGVKLNREFLVGDLETRVGLMVASGDYPDMLYAAHYTQRLVDANALIPLEDLIEEHAPNIKKYYAGHMESITAPDGHVYFLPQQAIPFGASERRYPALGFYINKRVLKDAGWPSIKTYDQYFELIENYMAKNPTYNGQSTIGYLTCFDSTYSYCTRNIPQHLMGYPNEGDYVALKEGNEFVVRPYNGGLVEKYYYQKLNEMYDKGVVDPEMFVVNYDQYIERLASGRVLGTFAQHWVLQQAQDILNRDDPDSILIPFPIVFDETVEEFMRDTPYIQYTQGMGITSNCNDPVTAIKYLDYLVANQTLIQWGIEGEHYEVDEDGLYYRTPAQQQLFRDPNWVRDIFGRQYFYNLFPSLMGIDENGNSYMPDQQPSMIYNAASDSEKEVMDGYGVKSFTGFYNPARPIQDVPYYPIWTITIETGSEAHIEGTRAVELMHEYIPKLVMSSPDEYVEIWEDYKQRINALLPLRQQVYQEQVDWRVENWGSGN
ncbi:MAG TPA: extracellular solute-binding protein [Halanaerobiales bacterium]|nr:extracellular solute-binding protein [Halanaerobiales bacterium]